jgi:hypothetical protein
MGEITTLLFVYKIKWQYALGLVGFKKLMGSWVRVLLEQTRTYEPARYRFMPINKPMGMKNDPNSYPNGVRSHRVSSTHYYPYTKPILAITSSNTKIITT